MAQDLAATGITMPGLMLAGRWKKDATALRYTQHLTAHDTLVGQYLKTQHHQTDIDNPYTEIRLLSKQPHPWLGGIAWGALDLPGAYRHSFEEALPHAGQVADPFGVIH